MVNQRQMIQLTKHKLPKLPCLCFPLFRLCQKISNVSNHVYRLVTYVVVLLIGCEFLDDQQDLSNAGQVKVDKMIVNNELNTFEGFEKIKEIWCVGDTYGVEFEALVLGDFDEDIEEDIPACDIYLISIILHQLLARKYYFLFDYNVFGL